MVSGFRDRTASRWPTVILDRIPRVPWARICAVQCCLDEGKVGISLGQLEGNHVALTQVHGHPVATLFALDAGQYIALIPLNFKHATHKLRRG